MSIEERLLESLNANQRRAASAPNNGILQIIAGPGTGKTKVLVARVAHLLLHDKVSPQNIIVTTFTKKAANEMMARLRVLFENTDVAVGNLLIGTFHSICFKIILRYGALAGLRNFSVADERDSLQILAAVLAQKLTESDWAGFEALPPHLIDPFRKSTNSDRSLDAKRLKRQISKLKAAGITDEEYARQSGNNALIARVYSAYQSLLAENKVLDFDDCLLSCYKIISRYPVLSHIQHTLVDEFQDTNQIQLQLMYEFARGHATERRFQHNVTIVGDPDQSIYAFRDAQAANFATMKDHYTKSGRSVSVIALDDNYRSTSAILHACETVMRQQKQRLAKNLRSQMSSSFTPLKAHLSSAEEEARWICHHIQYLCKLPAVVLCSDIAILVRSAYQTRVIETELTRQKIAYHMVRGKAFWERKEVVAMVDYLRCVANPTDRLAYFRAINFPKRGLGPKALSELEAIVSQTHVKSPDEHLTNVLSGISTGQIANSFGPKTRASIGSFLEVISNASTKLEAEFQNDRQEAVSSFFHHLYVTSGVKNEFKEDENCDMNVMEILAQLVAYEPTEDSILPELIEDTENLPASVEGLKLAEFIRGFLELVSLYDTDPEQENSAKPRVAISTIHGAKGLEWPVVFVPGMSDGLFPASFAIDESNPETVDEERRCFYVALSRAKVLLFVSGYTEKTGKWGRPPLEKISRFMESTAGSFKTEMEINTDEALGRLALLMGKSVENRDFLMAAHFKSYISDMLTYVREEVDVNAGFTTAQEMTRTPTTYRPFKRPAINTTSGPRLKAEKTMPRFEAGEPMKHPLKSVVQRAPAYIPTVNRTKKRLGTRQTVRN